MSARAIDTRWRSPPDRVPPRSPTTVSYPSGRRRTNSSTSAAYLGGSDRFDRVAEFATAYTDGNERDHRPLARAVANGAGLRARERRGGSR
jgi:hypothetical protein